MDFFKSSLTDTLLINGELDTALDTNSINPVQNKVIAEAINSKQNTLKEGNCIYIDADATIGVSVDNTLNSTSSNPVQNKIVYTALENKVSTTTYDNHVDNKTSALHVTSSEKAAWSGKQDVLTAGNSIEITENNTINVITDTELSADSINPVQNKVIKSLLDKKADDLSIEQVNILNYLTPGDLRTRINEKLDFTTDKEIYVVKKHINDGSGYTNVKPTTISAIRSSGDVGNPLVISGRQMYDGMMPKHTFMTLASHFANYGHLIAIRVRLFNVQDGYYAIKVYKQDPNVASSYKFVPRSLAFTSRFIHIEKNSESVDSLPTDPASGEYTDASAFGNEYTFEFDEPIVLSSLRDDDEISEEDKIGFQIICVSDNAEDTSIMYSDGTSKSTKERTTDGC